MVLDKANKLGDGGQTQPGQVTLQPGSDQTSAVEKLTSSIEEGKQYTGAETLKLVQDALAADGREQKDRAVKAEGEVSRLTGDLNGLTTQLAGLNTQMVAITQAQDEVELAKYAEDKPQQDSVRVRQANAAEKIRLQGVAATQNATGTKLAERETAVAGRETSAGIKLAAMAAGVDETRLANLVPDGDPGRLAEAATLLKGTGAPEIDPKTKLPGLTTTPATLASVGGDSKSVSEKMLADAKAK